MARPPGNLKTICGLDWIRRKTWPPPPRRPHGAVGIVVLFCGCGGLTIGAWDAARVNRRLGGLSLNAHKNNKCILDAEIEKVIDALISQSFSRHDSAAVLRFRWYGKGRTLRRR